MMNFSDTICAPATSVGTGAISILRICGPDSLAMVDRVIRFQSGTASTASGYSLKRGEAGGLDEVLVAIFRAPHSYTGEDAAEIYCHASPFIVGALIDRLTESGCRLAEPGEFTRRAFVNGKMDLAQAEAVADVISSTTAAQHRVAMNQLRGGYSDELRELRRQLLRISSLMELELDFAEEDVEFADRTRMRELLEQARDHCSRLADSFRQGNAVRNGVPVAIVGAPNSGKSTLLNALLRDERAIVSDIPGTTRDTIEETCVLDGVLFRFIDTAGIRSASEEVERLGIERTFRKLSEADIVLSVLDSTDDVEVLERTLADIAARIDISRQKWVLLLNKTDIRTDNKNVTAINNFVSRIDSQEVRPITIRISAKTASGLDRLSETLVGLAGIRSQTDTLVTNARHAAALRKAASALSNVSDGLDRKLPSDLLAEDLREAINALGTITGQITTEEILGEIFMKFCIGK